MSKVILITGASTGFGRDTAETLARAGHRVFASMRAIAGRNRDHAASLRAKKVGVVELDVTDDASIDRAVAAVLKEAGGIDVLVNNAGIGAMGISETFTTGQVHALFDVNVFGVQRMLRAVLPTLRSQGEGLVVNIGSGLGRVTLPFLGLYGATKFALESISESYRYELAQRGVDVVLVQPGAYPTDIYASALKPADVSRVSPYGEVGTILGKMGESFAHMLTGESAPNPHEVAEAIARLVDQPGGSRPARVVVGEPFGADVVNTTAAAVQSQLLDGMGLNSLTQSPPSAASVQEVGSRSARISD
jgi:NAD(P)-dependent dehydrogenase (short-subunit alcohol dehydrogenase family)